jgi:hypothetical protein
MKKKLSCRHFTLNLGLVKYFVKVMNQNFSASLCLEQKCPRDGKADTKEGIFLRPKIIEMIRDSFW